MSEQGTPSTVVPQDTDASASADPRIEKLLVKEYDRARTRFGEIFHECATAEERKAVFLRVPRETLEFAGYDYDEYTKQLDAICALDDEGQFVEQMFTIAKPYLTMRMTELGERRLRRDFNESHDFIVVNDLLSYGINAGTLHLHVQPNRTVTPGQLLRMMRTGLREIAVAVRDHPEVREVTGTSWIVKEHPKLAERLGFTIAETPDHLKKIENAMHATVSRDDFLTRFGS